MSVEVYLKAASEAIDRKRKQYQERSIARELEAEILWRDEPVREVVLTPRLYSELMREVGVQPTLFASLVSGYYLGAKLRPTSVFCRNCGAPAEPKACSYCKSPSDYVEFK